MRLGDLLVEGGVINRQQLEQALHKQRSQGGGRLGRILVDMGFVSDNALASHLSKQLHIPAVTQAMIDKVPATVVALMPPDMAAHYRVCPIALDKQRLHVAMSDPTDRTLLSTLNWTTRLEVRPLIATDHVLRYALKKHYGIEPPPQSIEVTADLDFDIDVVPAEAVEIDDGPPVDAPTFPDLFAPQTSDPAALSRLGEIGEISTTGLSQAGEKSLEIFAVHLLAGTNEDDLVDASLNYVAQDFTRVVMLVVKGDTVVGRRGRGPGASDEQLKEFATPIRSLMVVNQALNDGQPRIGRGSTALVGGLADVVGPPGDSVTLVLPARCQGRPIGCFVGIQGKFGVESKISEYVQAAKKIDLAFQMLILRRQILPG